MIDFEQELSKYTCIDSMDDVESSVESDELRDILDLLSYISVNIYKG